MKSIRLILLIAVSAIIASSSVASNIMPVSEVKKGMKGYGETVFEGSRLERFEIEVIGVLENFAPRKDLILIRVDHPIVNHSGIIAGMSGSPIYIDGRLVGALSYGWAFAKDPIAGVTPIEEMLRIGLEPGEASTGGGAIPAMTAGEFTGAMASGNLTPMFDRMLSQFSASASPAASSAVPLMMPLSISGLSSDTLSRFSGMFSAANMAAVPSGSSGSTVSASSNSAPFKAGDAVAGMLSTGDISMAATGTVTYVDGDKVYSFGHPFLDLGAINFPLAKAEIITVMPNLNRSVKVSNSGSIVGAMTQDRFAGTLGIVGQKAPMIPVEIVVEGSGAPSRFEVQVIRNPQLAPLLLAVAADSVITNVQRAAGERTVVMESEIELAGLPTIKLREGWAGAAARESIPMYLAVVSGYLMSNEFAETEILGVKVRLRHDDRLLTARLVDASIETPADGEVNPGDSIRVNARIKPFRGESFIRTFNIEVPRDQKAGKGYVFVGGGSDTNRLDFSLVPADPHNMQQLLGVIDRLQPSTSLVAGLYAEGEGAVAAGVYLPNLPPSMRVVVEGDSTNAPRALVRYHPVQQSVEKMDYVIDGTLKIDLQIAAKR